MQEREIIVAGAGGVNLAGTLALPEGTSGRTPAPGIVLVAGSGPTDRNGNQLPMIQTDLLKQLAAALTEDGIATLRYDKRGIAASGPPPKNQEQWGAYFAWENFVSDVNAALGWLQKQPEIAPTKTGILGHSEGGLLALSAAQQRPGGARPPAILILAATPGRPLDAAIKEQLTTLLKAQNATAAETKFFLGKNDAISAAIKKTGKVPADVPPGLAALYPPYLGRFLQSALTANPAALATKFPGPVLLIQGAGDVQISPAGDARALDAALRRRPKDNHELALIPGASHNLKRISSPNDPAFTGPVVPEALTKMLQWAEVFLGVPARRPG